MAIFSIQASNSLRFVNRKAYEQQTENDKADLNKRLFPDIEFKDRLYVDYCHPVQQNDKLWFQFITDYPDFDIFLHSLDNNSFTTLSASVAAPLTTKAGQVLSIYECFVDVSALSGCYFIEISAKNSYNFPIVYFFSEKFEVKEFHENTLLFSWYGNNSYNDGMHWHGERMSMRIEAGIYDIKNLSEKTSYNTTEYNLLTTSGKPIEQHNLALQNIPYWVYSKIGIGLIHDEFYVNNVGFNRPDALDLTLNGKTLCYTGTIELFRKDYEIYTEFDQITGELPIIEAVGLLINDNDLLLYSSTGIYNVQGNDRIYQLSKIDQVDINDDLFIPIDKLGLLEAEKTKILNLKYTQETEPATLYSFSTTPGNITPGVGINPVNTINLKRTGRLVSGIIKRSYEEATFVGENVITFTLSGIDLSNFQTSYANMYVNNICWRCELKNVSNKLVIKNIETEYIALYNPQIDIVININIIT